MLYGERYPIDEDFLSAIATMPETSGIALGFDRLVMLATGAPRLADVLGFCPADKVVAVAEAVVTTQRDFGNRAALGTGQRERQLQLVAIAPVPRQRLPAPWAEQGRFWPSILSNTAAAHFLELPMGHRNHDGVIAPGGGR